MALINVLDIRFLNNPAPIAAPYEIEIQFECLESLAHDLEWKLIYVGSGFPNDVELDSLLVGPIPTGVNKFVFTADPIDVSQIPPQDVLGVSVILLTASYDDREFVRVGFYNNNEYTDPTLRSKYDTLLSDGTDEERAAWKFEGVKNVEVQRNILTAKPRVTRFNIKWDNENFNDEPPEQEEPEGDADVVALDDLGEGEDDEEGDEDGEEQEGEESAAPVLGSQGPGSLAKDEDGDEKMVLDDEEEELGSGSDNDNEGEGEGEADGDGEADADNDNDNDDSEDEEEVEGIEVDRDAPGPSK